MKGIQGACGNPQGVGPRSNIDKKKDAEIIIDVAKRLIEARADVRAGVSNEIPPIQKSVQTVKIDNVKRLIKDLFKIETINKLQEAMNQFPNASFQVEISNAADLQELKKIKNVSSKLSELFGSRDLSNNTTYSLLFSESILKCLSVNKKRPDGTILKFAGDPIEIDKETGRVTRCLSVTKERPDGTMLNFIGDKDALVELDTKRERVTKCLCYNKKTSYGYTYDFRGDIGTPVKIDTSTEIVSECLTYIQKTADGDVYIFTGDKYTPVEINTKTGMVTTSPGFRHIEPGEIFV